jgi:hypothetical protein
MNKQDAVRAALNAGAQGDGPGWLFFDRGEHSAEEIEAQAGRLFDHAVKYKYGGAVLYAQQREWLGLTKAPFTHKEDIIAFTLFAAAVQTLSPLIDADAAPAAPEPQPETRAQGFDRGFDDDDAGGRSLKVGDERITRDRKPRKKAKRK